MYLVMIMGDFNFPDIDFLTGEVFSSDHSAAYWFFEKTQDLFLTQNVMCKLDLDQVQYHPNLIMSSLVKKISLATWNMRHHSGTVTM